ncbi:hypothetical protein GYB61_06200 [bacterium]|nr:hypothetical protein [bacterium]
MVDALKQAEARQRSAAAQGFDWPDIDGVWAKLHEEIEELQQAGNAAERAEELGDLLFMLVNLSRHLGIDPQQALADGTAKFDRRFASVCAQMREQGVAMSPETLPQMEAAWQVAKRMERTQPGGYRLASFDDRDDAANEGDT